MQYCEQGLAIAHFEPWNALTNLAFIAAAIGAGWQARHLPHGASGGELALMVLAVAIGAGSFAWHATQARWAELADVLPILGFVLVFLFLAVRRFFSASAGMAGCACAAMLLAIVALVAVMPGALNGSIAYLPVWIGLTVLAATAPAPAIRAPLRIAAALFAVSLAARTVDLAICNDFPHGSHWLWHLCNGGVIYLALRAILATGTASASSLQRG